MRGWRLILWNKLWAYLCLAGVAGTGAVLVGGGGTTGSEPVKVVTGGEATPTPAPAPSPVPTADPAPAPAPAPAPVASEPEPYVLGKMTWSFGGDAPGDKRTKINDSMDWLMNQINTLTDNASSIWVVYGADTPTADASFQGQIRFGGTISRRVALHESHHWLGVGTTWEYRSRVRDGAFHGDITDRRIHAFDGPDSRISGDQSHFWPYGNNYDNEFANPQRSIAIVSAMRGDFGWADAASAIKGDRRFQNRSSRMILDAGSGGAPLQRANAAVATQAWKTDYVDGFIILKTGTGNLSLDSLGNRGNGDNVALRATAPGEPAQQWEMIPTDGGWFLLRNRATGKCLDNMGNPGAGGTIHVWDCAGSSNQQWHLVR